MSRFVASLPLVMIGALVLTLAISLLADSGYRPPMRDVMNTVPHLAL